MVSRICQEFGCTPDVALQQNPRVIFPVMEYRVGMEAKAIHNGDVRNLAKHPGLVEFWKLLTGLVEEENG